MFLLKGLLIGLIFGLPVGAVGTLTLQRTINYNSKVGFITGLGSSVADILYACIGVFGISIISYFLIKHQIVINIIGSIFIFVMGIQTIKKQAELKKEKTANGLGKIFLSSFVIGITNPATILSFIFAFSYFNIMENIKLLNGILLLLGVLIGTLIWWTILVFIGNKLKKNINENRLKIINIVFGVLLIVFSISIVIKTVI